MLLTRPGFEERVKGSSNMQEMLKWLPSDLFRTCLARVSIEAGQIPSFCVPAFGEDSYCMCIGAHAWCTNHSDVTHLWCMTIPALVLPAFADSIEHTIFNVLLWRC